MRGNKDLIYFSIRDNLICVSLTLHVEKHICLLLVTLSCDQKKKENKTLERETISRSDILKYS